MIQSSIVKNQNNERFYMYKTIFKCTEYYMNQSIYKTEKHSNTILHILQVFWTNQFLNSQINIYYLDVIFLIRLFILQLNTGTNKQFNTLNLIGYLLFIWWFATTTKYFLLYIHPHSINCWYQSTKNKNKSYTSKKLTCVN